MLKIYIKNSDDGKDLLQAVNYGQIPVKGQPRKIEIPYKYTIKGSLELLFIELAPVKGLWGVRDLLIADRYADRAGAILKSKASGGAENQGTLPSDEKDHIIEAK